MEVSNCTVSDSDNILKYLSNKKDNLKAASLELQSKATLFRLSLLWQKYKLICNVQTYDIIFVPRKKFRHAGFIRKVDGSWRLSPWPRNSVMAVLKPMPVFPS